MRGVCLLVLLRGLFGGFSAAEAATDPGSIFGSFRTRFAKNHIYTSSEHDFTSSKLTRMRFGRDHTLFHLHFNTIWLRRRLAEDCGRGGRAG